MANDPNEVAVALFNGAISDIRGSALIAKHIDATKGENTYKDNTENFFTLITILESKLEEVEKR